MHIDVAAACAELEARGLLKRRKPSDCAKIIAYVEELLGCEAPSDLMALYREHIDRVGDFSAMTPIWNDWVGWRTAENHITQLLHARCVPIMDDGCGNLFGLDLASGDQTPAVYFFDHEREFEAPEYAAGSSLGAFLLLMGDHDRAFSENWPERWELAIDPDLEKCPRAPASWHARR